MPQATQAFHNRIALAPGSLDSLLRQLGVDPGRFRKERVHPLDDAGWDHSLARCHDLIQLSEEQGGSVTHETLANVGRELELFDGLPEAFDAIRDTARSVVEDIDVEFYVLTAGFAEIVNGTAIAEECEAAWGSSFHCDHDGCVAFPKRIVTYPEKVRYLMALAKDIRVEGHDAPADVWRQIPDTEYHVPLDQMIYVGDGASDLPGFNLLEDHSGLALGVRKEDDVSKWSVRHEIHEDRRVQNLAAADYTPGSELLRSLRLGVDSISKLVALRKLGHGE